MSKIVILGAGESGAGAACLLYTSDAADELSSVDLGGRRIIKKTKEKENEKGSLENYLAGDYRRTYCRRHHARRYQLHVN